MDLKEALKDDLTDDELEKLISSFEVIGDIAIIEIHEDLRDKREIIGEKLMKINKHIETVLIETSERKGKFRKREYKIIAGRKDTETIHKEHGCRFKLDPTLLYFSEREATERQRITERVNEGEKILDMFAGIGPFSIVIAKNKKDVNITAIELNPDAYNYLKENIELNKVSNKVTCIQGDARKICPFHKNSFDRIIMHLPKTSEKFIGLAIDSLKPRGGIIHYYSWGEEGNLYDTAEDVIEKVAKKNNMEYTIKDRRKVLPYAPRKWKTCLDVQFK